MGVRGEIVNLNKIENSGKKISGIKKPMICISCNRQCGIIFESESLLHEQQFRCVCPCGGKTFLVKSENRCYFIQSPDLDILEWNEDNDPQSLNDNYIITLGFKK